MNKQVIILTFLIILGMSINTFAANEIIDIKLDKNIYSPGETISLSGTLYSGEDALENATITVEYENQTKQAITNAFGNFNTTITPSNEGENYLIITHNALTLNKTIKVKSIQNIKLSIISSTSEPYEVITLSNNATISNINGSGSLGGELMYGSFRNNISTYYTILQKEAGDENYKSLFISEDPSFQSISYNYLEEGSKIGIDEQEYTIFYLSPSGKKAILLRQSNLEFIGTGSETAGLFILPLNSSGEIINKNLNLTIQQINEKGILENISNGSITPLISETKSGFKVQELLISDKGGKHNIIIEGISHITYFVKKFLLKTAIETVDGTPISSASKGQLIILKATVIDVNNGTSIPNAVITANIIMPNGSEEIRTLNNNGQNIFISNYTLDLNLEGDYLISYSANYSGDLIKKENRVKVKSYKLFMKSFSPEKGKGEGFAPSSEGILVIGGNDFVTGDLINLSGLTDDCNNSKIFISSIFSENNKEYISNFTVYTLSGLFTAKGVSEDWIKNDMYKSFGKDACAIEFTTPRDSGTFKLEVDASIQDISYKLKDYIEITSLFAYGMPVNCLTGGFSDSISPGAKSCIKVNVYEPSTWNQVSPQNITGISLMEVNSISSGLITDQIRNVTFIAFPNGEKGFSFFTGNKTLGHHEVTFRVKANTSSGTQSGTGRSWFRTELWNAWARPACDNLANAEFSKSCNFGSTNNITIRVESFSSGFGSGQEGLTAIVSSIRNFETGETLSGDILSDSDISCQTIADNSSSNQDSNNSQSSGIVKPAKCDLIIPAPQSGWNSGGNEVEITIKDANDNTMTIYSSFKIESFEFWVWNKNWEMTKAQDANFEVRIQDFLCNQLNATVILSKIYYRGKENSWMEPREIENLTFFEQTIINGVGTYTIDKDSLSGLKEGFYEIVFTATSQGVGKQTARAGFNLKSFVVFPNHINNNFERTYEIGGNLTINVTAFDTISWNTWPPSGIPHNITNASVKRINKNGMWEKPYLQGGKDNISETASCTKNSCVLTVPLTGFEQSNYDIEIEVTDELLNKATTQYWFKTETYTITVPEIHDWRTASTKNNLLDSMILQLDTKAFCGSSSDPVTEPLNVSVCYIDMDKRLPTIINREEQNKIKRTMFLLDKTDNQNPILFINKENNSLINGQVVHYNFSLASTQKKGVGENFVDSNGYNWKILAIDSGTGKITLQSLDGVIVSRTMKANNNGGENEIEFLNIYIINKSLSKSGTFLFMGREGNEEKIWDDYWSSIDLDGDGKYNCEENNTTFVWECEEYFALLYDGKENRTYDTLIISPTRNMTLGINSNYGLTGNGDMRFNITADPIYLLNMIYSETNGIGNYRIITTTNRAGWPGKHLGLFKVGNEHVKIPVMVATPSTKEGIEDKEVVIRKLKDFGKTSINEYWLSTPYISNTSNGGIALLDINLSNIPSGEYMVIIEINESGNYITTGNDWDNPKIELRSFSLSNLFGQKGQIDTMIEWSENAGNLFRLNSSETIVKNNGIIDIRLRCNSWDNEVNSEELCHVDDWRFRELWVNITSQQLFKTNNPNNNYLYNADINISSIKNQDETMSLKDDFGGEINYIFKNASKNNEQINLNVGESKLIPQSGRECSFNITLVATITDLMIAWDVYETCPWGKTMLIEEGWNHTIDENRFLWGLFNISSVGNNSATINMFKPILVLQSPVSDLADYLEEGNDGRVRVVLNAFNSGFDLYLYNDNETKTRDDLDGRTGSLDKVLVVDSASGNYTGFYKFGEAIPILGNKAVVKADSWNQYVYMSNLTIDGSIVYPLPWSCDEEKYYVGKFSEQALGFKLYDGGMCQILDSDPYYILLLDNMCNGDWEITSAYFDDDTVLDNSWAKKYEGCEPGPANDYNCYKAYDYLGEELGAPNDCFGDSQDNQDERWIEIGRESHPVSITKYSELDSGNLDLFKRKDNVNFEDNITQLSLWVQAKNFDGTLIEGDVNIEKATGTRWSCGQMLEEEISIPTTDGIITSGIGYLNLILTNLTSSNPSVKFKVQDNISDLRYEYITKNFWYSKANENKNNEQCEGSYISSGNGGGYQTVSSSSGGGGGYFIDPMQKCLDNQNITTCEANNCLYLNSTGLQLPLEAQDFFGEDIPENICVPCFIYDKDEDSCISRNDTCNWIAPGTFGVYQTIGKCEPKAISVGGGNSGGGGSVQISIQHNLYTIPFGDNLSKLGTLTNSNFSYLENRDIDWNDDLISVKETLNFNGVKLFNNNISGAYLGTINHPAMKYRFIVNDSSFNSSSVSMINPLEIDILGKPSTIIELTNNTMKLVVAQEFYLNVGDSVILSNKTITLVNVGNSGSPTVIVNVNGVIETVTLEESVNGIKIFPIETFYADTIADRAAVLLIGDRIMEFIADGDPMEYFGEPSQTFDAEWVWQVNSGINFADIGADFNQIYDNVNDSVKYIGEPFKFPNNYSGIYIVNTTETDANIEIFVKDFVWG